MSNRLLLDESPLVVQPSLAVAVGLHQAIFLQQVHYLLRISKNVRDGRRWVWNTLEAWRTYFPFWTVSALWRIIDSLRKGEVLLVEKYRKGRGDQTLWFSIDYDVLERRVSEIENPDSDAAKSTVSENEKSLLPQERLLTDEISSDEDVTWDDLHSVTEGEGVGNAPATAGVADPRAEIEAIADLLAQSMGLGNTYTQESLKAAERLVADVGSASAALRALNVKRQQVDWVNWAETVDTPYALLKGIKVEAQRLAVRAAHPGLGAKGYAGIW